MSTDIPYVDETINAVVGCEHSGMPGCDNCWSRELHEMRHKAYLAGKPVPKQYAKPFSEIQLLPERIERVLHMRKPRTIFWCSTADMFHKDVPFGFIDQMFAAMALTPQHTHLILTKRVNRMAEYFAYSCEMQKNVWPGISCSTQKDLDEMVPILFQIPAAHYWLSAEPLLEGVRDHCNAMFPGDPSMARGWVWSEFDWVVLGAESGPGRRPCDIKWVRSVARQVKEADTALYVKQLDIDGKVLKDPKDFPEDLRIREIPKR